MDMKQMMRQAQKMQAELAKAQEEINTMTAEATAILDENEKLSHRLETPGDVKTIREIAEEELDLVTPDTVLIELQ